MRLGLHFNIFTEPGQPPAETADPATIADRVASTAKRTEDAGFSSISVMDHFFQIIGQPEDPMLEAYTLLGFIAGRTRRIRLGPIVTGVTYRQPALLLKAATTLDVLSGGRSFFGIGAAWFEGEHHALGFAFPPLAERFRRLEEVLQIAHGFWALGEESFKGEFYHLQRMLCVPAPVQRPRPPIVVGGGGEKKTLRLVAQYADACNIFDAADDEIRHKLDVLREHCDRLGRPYDRIEKAINSAADVTRDGRDGSVTPAALLDRYGRLAELGVNWVNIRLSALKDPAAFDLLAADVIPTLAKIEPRAG